MKKLLYVLTALLIFSCSSSDDSSSASGSDFNPPAWIQGTWSPEGMSQGQNVDFRFAAHDFCFSSFSSETCWQGAIDLYRTGGAKSSVEEISTSTSYTVKINTMAGQSTTYKFNKISEMKIEYTSMSGAVFTKR